MNIKAIFVHCRKLFLHSVTDILTRVLMCKTSYKGFVLCSGIDQVGEI